MKLRVVLATDLPRLFKCWELYIGQHLEGEIVWFSKKHCQEFELPYDSDGAYKLWLYDDVAGHLHIFNEYPSKGAALVAAHLEIAKRCAA